MGRKTDGQLLPEAVRYFREQKGFERLARLFVAKYKSLGRCAGNVRLTPLTSSEREFLARFFRRDYGKQQSAVVSLEKFQQALDKTRFAGVMLEELLEGFTGEKLVTRAEERERYQTEKGIFFKKLQSDFAHPRCRRWLENILNRGPYSRGIHLAYDSDREKLQRQLVTVLKALERLPLPEKEKDELTSPAMLNKDEGQVRFERLPLFASRITGDPHSFDPDREEGRFLLSALQYLQQAETRIEGQNSALTSEQTAELLQYFGIVRDDLLNFVTCTGLVAFRQGKMLTSWQAAWEEGSVLNVPLRELLKLSAVVPVDAHSFTDKERAVFVVENSGVFSGIIDYCASFRAGRLPPLIGTHGQFNLAALLLLDLLAAGGATIYYSGDFDPEGLKMAQRLATRYGLQLKLWHYGLEDYEACYPGKTLDAARLKKLDSISSNSLLPVKQRMLISREARYQEKILASLIHDVQQYFY